MNSKIRRSLAVAILAALSVIPFAHTGNVSATEFGVGPMASHALIHG